MTDTKMLQMVLDGQVEIRQDLKRIEKKVESVEKNLTTRIDNIGLQLAELEDDAPTRKEHDRLEKRVTKLETRIATV